ncbi:MAG TPA: AMP-binding protein [Bacteroidales bacterium]|nr:AMP-binding protein [Bacteroidales bacterium]HPS17065.1 AMP-binding protein [Bacteroidales bacterium]
MEIKRIFDLVSQYHENWPERTDALAGKDNNAWVKFSTTGFVENVNNISYGLLALGIEKGDKIASITFNRPEWNFIDMGVQQIGAIHISIYPTISDKDYEYILKHAEVKYIFVAGI